MAEASERGLALPDPSDVASIGRNPNDDYLIALARRATVRALVSGDPAAGRRASRPFALTRC